MLKGHFDEKFNVITGAQRALKALYHYVGWKCIVRDSEHYNNILLSSFTDRCPVLLEHRQYFNKVETQPSSL